MHPKPITQRKTYEEIRARRKKRRWKKVTERRSTFASATHGWRGNTLDSAVRWANALESHWAFLFLLLTMRLRLNKRSAGHSMDLAHFSVFRFRSSWLSPCCSVSSTMSSSSSSDLLPSESRQSSLRTSSSFFAFFADGGEGSFGGNTTSMMNTIISPRMAPTMTVPKPNRRYEPQ